jgi:heptaprenylglyceryl phosphate synthase
MPIVVNGFVPSIVSLTALSNSLIIRVPTGLDALSKFNVEAFSVALMNVLNANNITFIQRNNLNTSILVTACVVERAGFGYAELRSTVCGVNDTCTGKRPDCPPFVSSCVCPAYVAPRAFSQQNTPAEGNYEVQVEATITLENSPAFKPTSTAAITETYRKMEFTLIDSLSLHGNPVWSAFAIHSDTILVGEMNSTVYGSTPRPTSRLTVATPVPVTPSPNSASRAHVGIFFKELFAMALLVIFLVG